MIKVKVFKIFGEISKPNFKTSFVKEVVAIKPEEAVEKVYAEIGSKHRVKRFQMKIVDVREVAPQDIENHVLQKLMGGE